MRQIGTLPDEQQARRFQDYLLARGMKSMVEADDEAWLVWIHDEDQVEPAREELAQFTADPEGETYIAAAEAAKHLRKVEAKRNEQAKKRSVDVRQQWRRPLASRCRVTYGLIYISVIVTVLSTTWQNFPKTGDKHEPIIRALSIASFEIQGNTMRWDGLADLGDGQVWRMFTPMFLHFSIFHIFFNMYMLRIFGTAIEIRRGAWRYLGIVLLIAAVSNLGQYGAGRLYQYGFDFIPRGGPNFGGMSGVVYGLFGYIWMKSRFDPGSGFFMPPNLVVWLIAWFFICMTGAVGNIANTAHGVGLGVGMALGYLPLVMGSARK
jgi:GlpG protein